MVEFSFPFPDFHIGDISVAYSEPQGCPYIVESLYARCARIEDKHVSFFVIHDLQYMGVATNEYVGPMRFDQLEGLPGVSARITAYMDHQNLFPFDSKNPCKGLCQTYFMVIAISIYAYERAIGGDGVHGLDISEIPGMPYLIHGLEKIFQNPVENAVSIGK